MSEKRFIAAFDLHLGYERRGGHKVPLHDPKAWEAMMKFASDFKPDHFILGGDTVDCGPISHFNKRNPGRVEGLRLLSDIEEAKKSVILPVEKLSKQQPVYIMGNHEAWVDQFIDENPILEGIVDLPRLLELNKWKVVPRGAAHTLGKLTFVHGDQLSGGEHIAKAAVIAYERNIRFGHFHTYQVYTKTSPVDSKLAKTGVAVPCLCTKGPKYGEGKPNKWVQGFLWGFIYPDGSFNDYVTTIFNGRFNIMGKTYKG